MVKQVLIVILCEPDISGNQVYIVLVQPLLVIRRKKYSTQIDFKCCIYYNINSVN